MFKKTILYILFLLAVTIIIIELIPFILSPVILKKSFSRASLSAEFNRNDNSGDITQLENENEEHLGEHILHPYLGFVGVPRSDFNKYCFPGSDPLTKKSDHKINICLTGGSVATGLYTPLKELLSEGKSSDFKDKEINLVMFALGGFKQPQQLMSLNYFLYLGAEYDIVINVDGFNEIVLPYSENLPFGVHSSYPRHWNFYSRKKMDSRVHLLIARQVSLNKEKENLKKLFYEKKLCKSNFGLFLWKIMDNRKSAEVYDNEEKLRHSIAESPSDYQNTGPEELFSDTTGFFVRQANAWGRASLLMNEIGKLNDFDYYHFLQPNQYLPGSKTLTNEEIEQAYEQEAFVYKEAVQIGYPILIKEGDELIKNNLKFYDLTHMFIDENRTLYSDKCCHFNKLGYYLISKKIAEEIFRNYKSKDGNDQVN